MGRDIKVLVVEDSPTVREHLVHTFNTSPGMKVVATAASGQEAVAAVRTHGPDVVTMDVKMPGMDGLEATRRIMHETPVPIVIVSGIFDDQVSASFQALEAGALAFVRKPTMAANTTQDLVRTVRQMSEVKVVRRNEPIAGASSAPALPKNVISKPRDIQIIAIGASTGGPPALVSLLNALPVRDIPPVLIVQHIAEGFTEGLESWLRRSTPHDVRQAKHGETITAGHVYIAPEGHHLGIQRDGKVNLDKGAPENGLRPAVSYLFRSALAAYGAATAAVLLSGMGKDGARELLDLRHGGAATFAQDQGSALIFGMPGEAIRLDAAQYIMPPPQIGVALGTLTRQGIHAVPLA